jgi:SAM-dependent methyltransferase
VFSKMINTLLLPLRLICSHEFVNKLGLRSIRDERCDKVMENCSGRLLDIGCGNNQLVKKYGNDSIGIDVYDFGGDAVIVEDTSKLPFADGSFDAISFVASINHIPNRGDVLKESYRVLSANGKVVATMLSPTIGAIRHKLAWWDEDQGDRGIKDGEKPGLSYDDIVSLFEHAGFRLVKRQKLICRLNNLYVFEKKAAQDIAAESQILGVRT